MAGSMPMPLALARFLTFTLSQIDDFRRPRFAALVQNEWYAKPSEVREYINQLIEGLNEICHQTEAFLDSAVHARKQVDTIPANEPRAIIRQLRVYLEELQKLQRCREACLAVHRSFVEQEITRAGFGPEVVELLTLHVQLWGQREIEAIQLARHTQIEIQRLKRRPGGNSKKVPYGIDKNAIKLQLNRSVRSLPFEHQPQRASDIPPGNWLPGKDTHMPATAMSDNTRWHGDLQDPYNREPMEYYCQRTLASRPEARSCIVPALKCEVDYPNQTYRMYLPFCAYGDLEDLIVFYRDHKTSAKPASENPYGLPEPFLWRVFQALVEAGMIMEHGGVCQPVSDGSWKQIVHRDLKPANVFLDFEPGPGHPYPWYPQVKLADFGLAIETHKRDPLNPLVYTGAGTRRYRAPEQLSFMDSQTGQSVDNFKILAHTNVWGIGAVLWTLCNRRFINDDDALNYLPTQAAEDIFGQGSRFEIDRKYMWRPQSRHLSTELKDLVEGCMRFDPAQRPTFVDLYEAIGQFMRDYHADGKVGSTLFRAANGYQPQEDSTYGIQGLRDEVYMLGFAYPGPERPEENRVVSRTAGGGAAEDDDDVSSATISRP